LGDGLIELIDQVTELSRKDACSLAQASAQSEDRQDLEVFPVTTLANADLLGVGLPTLKVWWKAVAFRSLWRTASAIASRKRTRRTSWQTSKASGWCEKFTDPGKAFLTEDPHSTIRIELNRKKFRKSHLLWRGDCT